LIAPVPGGLAKLCGWGGVYLCDVKRRLKLYWFLLASLLVCAAGLLLASRDALIAPVIVLGRPYQMPQSTSLFERWVPLSWGWLWRLKEAVFVRRKVDLEATIVELGDASGPALSGLALGEPSFTDTNGLRVWLLEETKVDEMRRQIARVAGNRVLSCSRISTADGIGASVFVGDPILVNGATNFVGTALDCFTRVHHDSTDLTANFRFSEVVTNQPVMTNGLPSEAVVSVQTNLDVAARLQIPMGGGVFLVDAGSKATNGKRMGVILSARSPKARKK
jgi:hypothetical protein